MGKHRFDKLFSAEEANELIPRLEVLVRDLQIQADAMRKRISDLARFDDKLSQLDLPKVIARYPEPVSYTHLDVYKRQLNDSCNDIGWISENGKLCVDQNKYRRWIAPLAEAHWEQVGCPLPWVMQQAELDPYQSELIS